MSTLQRWCAYECHTEKATKAWHRPGRRKHNNPRMATINPNVQQPAPATHQTLDSTPEPKHELNRRTPTSTATLHARDMRLARTTSAQTQQGHCKSPHSRHISVCVADGPCCTVTQTPPATLTADETRGTSLPEGPVAVLTATGLPSGGTGGHLWCGQLCCMCVRVAPCLAHMVHCNGL